MAAYKSGLSPVENSIHSSGCSKPTRLCRGELVDLFLANRITLLHSIMPTKNSRTLQRARSMFSARMKRWLWNVMKPSQEQAESTAGVPRKGVGAETSSETHMS